jgi:competence protein ComEC
VTPAHVIVSVAKFNKFKHPSRFIIDRFRAAGAAVYRTDVEGAVVFESDGRTIRKLHWRSK